ncbi:MAG: hypothetical protein SGJ24_01255 [Chloroflexota bacterium]|nr:hypothetical protein [Chloroflexota bacterium]
MTYRELVRGYFDSHYALLGLLQELTHTKPRDALLIQSGQTANIVELLDRWQAFIVTTFAASAVPEFAVKFTATADNVRANLATGNALSLDVIAGAKRASTKNKNRFLALDEAVQLVPTNPDWLQVRLLAVAIWGSTIHLDF